MTIDDSLTYIQGDTIIIQKALGRENIDEVIKLSEDYKAAESEWSLIFIFPLIITALRCPP